MSTAEQNEKEITCMKESNQNRCNTQAYSCLQEMAHNALQRKKYMNKIVKSCTRLSTVRRQSLYHANKTHVTLNFEYDLQIL